MKSRGLALCIAHGPSDTRRLTACHYARPFRLLSTCWGRAAEPLFISVPAPLLRETLPADHPYVLDIAPILTPKPVSPVPEADIPRGSINAAVAKSVFPPPETSSAPTLLGLLEPAPPAPEMDIMRGSINPAIAESVPPRQCPRLRPPRRGQLNPPHLRPRWLLCVEALILRFPNRLPPRQ